MEKITKFLKGKRMYIVPFLLLSSNAMATTADAPWVGMLDKFMGILVGPTARVIAIIAIAGVGFSILAGLTDNLSKRAIGVIVGISVIFAAATWGPKFFGYSGAILM